ncbi:MAG: redoxin domain-containing protein [Vicinamibacterales bacterium]
MIPLLLLSVAISVAQETITSPAIGSAAPAFLGHDDQGLEHRLENYRGKWVVLEWHEKGCPYVTKHYRSGNVPALQAEWTSRGVVWLLINSSTAGSHSFLTPTESKEYMSSIKSAATASLLDPEGRIGRAYGALTALHMVVINPEGKIVYLGAIDDKPTTSAADIPGARNYVRDALTQAMAGKPVATPSTTPYGCSVHYAATTGIK